MAQVTGWMSWDEALNYALEAGDPDLLLAFLTSPEGEAVPRTWEWVGHKVAAWGDAGCLRVLHECGFALSHRTWQKATSWGHIHCLQFAVSKGYTLNDRLLYSAMNCGHLACVEFLLRQGLPRRPFLTDGFWGDGDQLKCLRAVLDKGVAIDPRTLMFAAEEGQVEYVRVLHEHRVPLWRHARDATAPWESAVGGGRRDPPGTLVNPWRTVPCDLWTVFRYGAAHGAPITPRIKQVFEEKQQPTRAVLHCFKAAARLCQGPGGVKERRVWARMAAAPAALIEEILISAEMEIREFIRRGLSLRAAALAP